MLEIMRYFFIAYTDPQRNAWEMAFMHAQNRFGTVRGPVIVSRALDVVQAMRLSRKSSFRYSNPYCTCCRERISHSEKHIMETIRAFDRGDPVAAQANALVLCEGHDTGPFLKAAKTLALVA